MAKYKPLKDLQKESLRVRFANTLASLENRADGLDVSAAKLRETACANPGSGLAQAAAWCEQAQQHLRAAHGAVAAFIADLEKE